MTVNNLNSIQILNGVSMVNMPNVRYEKDGTVYIFKNMKIVKGQADYARIVVVDEKRTLNKLTVAEGATVLLNNNPYIKEIVGEGNAKRMSYSR